MKKVKVAVLISTYNGALYLESQLNSVLAQHGMFEISVFIRDDGSNDDTRIILNEYCADHSNVSFVFGDNLGVVGSFLWLVENAEKHDYYAFCDQDDIWHPLKIQAALFTMSKGEPVRPSVYCSSYDYVDKDLKLIGRGSSLSNFKLNNLLIENCAPGCTVVFNHALMLQCRTLPLSEIHDEIIMHDWFIVLIGSLIGDIYYDFNSYLSYRQHESNVVGANYGLINSFINKAKRILSNKDKCKFKSQAKVLLCNFKASIKDEDIELLTGLINDKSIFTRIGYLYNLRLHRNKIIDNLAFKLLFIFGYYK